MRNIYGSPLPLHPVAVAVAVATVNGGVKAPLLTSMGQSRYFFTDGFPRAHTIAEKWGHVPTLLGFGF